MLSSTIYIHIFLYIYLYLSIFTISKSCTSWRRRVAEAVVRMNCWRLWRCSSANGDLHVESHQPKVDYYDPLAN